MSLLTRRSIPTLHSRNIRLETSIGLDEFSKKLNQATQLEDRIDILNDLNLSKSPPGDYSKLFAIWFKKNPEEALRYAQSLEDESIRIICLLEGADYFRENPEQLFQLLNSFNVRSQGYEEITSGLFSRFASVSPSSAINLLNDKRFLGAKELGVKIIVKSVVEQKWATPHDVYLVINSLNSSNERKLALNTLLQAPECKISMIECGLYSSMIKDDESLKRRLFDVTIKNEISTLGYKGLIKEIDSGVASVPKEYYPSIIEGGLQSLSKSQDVHGAITELNKSTLAKNREYEPTVVRWVLSNSSISNARDYVTSLDDSNPNKSKATLILSQQMISADVNEAANWIQSMPSGRQRDVALQPLLDYLKKTGEVNSYNEWLKLRSGK